MKYDEYFVKISLEKNNGIRISGKLILALQNAVGIKAFGKIDFLVNHKGYRFYGNLMEFPKNL